MNKRAFIPISALMGALLLALVAAMTPFVVEPDRAHAQALSADATLSGLTVVGGPSGSAVVALAQDDADGGGFDADVEDYTVRIGFNDSGVRVTPTAMQASDDNDDTNDSIIRVNGKTVASAATEEVNLATRDGMTTTITIQVTAPLRSVTKTYTVKVYRERQTPSTNANLASLGISPGSLSPAFSSGTTSYKARVQADMVTLSPSLYDTGGGASIVDISAAYRTGDSGTATPAYDPATKKVTLGDEATSTVITVRVTPESVLPSAATACDVAGVKCYTIEVYHIRANRETNANLATLTSTPVGGAEATNGGFTLDTTHTDGTTLKYNQRVTNPTTHVTIAAGAADPGAVVATSPSDARPGTGDDAGHQIALRAGAETTVTVTVTAEDTARKQVYTITVYRERATLSTNNNLNSLSLSAGTLTPAFNRDTIGYDAQVAANVSKVTVSYAASDTAGGSRVVVSSTDDSEVTNNEVDLEDAGSDTNVTVTVTSESGADKVYTITVYRLRSLPSADASLSAITVSQGTLDPTPFAATTKTYNVNVAHNISAIDVDATATGADNGATVAITPDGGNEVDLTAGMRTLITITVTAEDRTTTDTYMVYVYRQRANASEDATLSALSLSAGTLSPAFMSDTIEYKARVSNDVGEVTVSATLNDNAGGASVAVSTPGADGLCSGADNVAASGNKVSLDAGDNTTICVITTAEDGSTNKTYSIMVYRTRANPNDDADLTSFTIAESTGTLNIADGTTTSPETTLDLLATDDPDVVYRVRQVTVVAMADVGAIITIMPTDADTGKMGHQVDLTAGAETMITVEVMPEDSAAMSKTYTANVYRKNIPGSESDDAMLSSLRLSGVTLMYKDDNDMDMTGFMSDVMAYTGNVASARTTVTAMANHIGAQSGITITPADVDMSMDGHQVNIAAVGGEVTVTVQVRPESVAASAITAGTNSCADTAPDSALECYTVMLTRVAEQEPMDEAGLLATYDTNGTDGIQIDELVLAVRHYAAGTRTIEELVILVRLYATG